jgi:uncharacterized membrane protein (DUF4010 family)
MVSSTAATISLARRSREAPESSASVLCAGIAVSWAMMFLRVGVEVAIVSPFLLPRLAPMLAGLALALALCALALARHAAGDRARDDALGTLRNPFRMRAAIQFAAIFAAVLLATKLVATWLPERGIYAVAALSGAVDVDAITLSVARMATRSELEASLACQAIVLAALTNSVMKWVYAMVLGTGELRRRLLLPGGIVLVGGAVALLS